ncbi:MAG: carboxypeptidase regulatory-like domain-containing protein [Patescibacteria group bacterium]|nr:carboxypeptidase regulatory-like domain-containing protein [Patescibacteria group bacterium]
MLSKSWRKLFAVVVSLGLIFSVVPPPSSSATSEGTLSNVSVSPSSSASSGLTLGATTNFTFTFTTATVLSGNPGDGVTINFVPSSWSDPQNPWGRSGITKGGGSSAAFGTLSLPSSAFEPVFVNVTSSVPAGTALTLKLNGVVNPSTAGAYIIQIGTVSNMTEKDKGQVTVFVGNAAYLVGKVVKVDGGTTTPIANRYVMVHTRDWIVNKGVNTGADGVFYVSGLTAGTYIVEVTPPAPNDTTTTGFIQPDLLEIAYTGATMDLSADPSKFIKFTKAAKTITGTVKKSDGTAVVGAQVMANKQGAMGQPNMTTTGNDGSFTLYVGGGEWSLFVSPGWDPQSGGQKSVDWTFTGRPPTVSFVNDASVETKTQDLTVTKASSKIKGKVIKPDGTPLAMAGINIWSMNGVGTGGGLDQNGAFEVSVPAGTYQVGIFTQDETYSAPTDLTASVIDGQTLDMGNITLITKKSSISGKVKDENGNGIGGIRINAWAEGAGGSPGKQTEFDGSYSIKVTPGTWQVMAEVDYNSALAYTNTQPPKRVTIGDNQNLTGIDFTMTATNSRISGQVVDTNNTLLSDFFGFAFVEGALGPGSGGPIQGGKFLLKVPAGTYKVGVGSPPGSDYTADETKNVTVAADETASVNIMAKKNDAKITGALKDDEGNLITNATIEIFAENGAGGFQQMLSMSGSYSLNVSAGTWRIGFWDTSSSGYMTESVDDNKVAVASGQTVTKDLTLKKANATITGKVTKPDGSAMINSFVTVDNKTGQKSQDEGKRMMANGTMTDGNGNYTLRVPAGEYYVSAHIPPGQGYINPDRVQVSVAKNGEATVNLAFKTADAKITGKVTQSGTAKYGAFVRAWAEKGGYSETRVNSLDGVYELSVSKGDNWHVGAILEDGKKVYKSSEIIVSVTSASATQDLTLNESSLTLPDPVTVTFDSTQMEVVNLTDGTELSLPANSLATSGDVTLTATPKAELQSEKTAQPIGIGYDFTAVNASGSAITTFNNSISITVPYTDQQLTDSKASESDLTPSYWDENSGTWRSVGTATVDKDSKTVNFTTNHFTSYALVAAADTTPPSAPTGVSVTNAESGALTIAWTNPTSDFSYAKVYRSTTSGSLGTVIANNQTGTSYKDTGLTNGTTYYYTVRAVDAAGNESTNTAQVSGTPSGTGLPNTGAPFIPAFAALLIGAVGLAVVRKTK